jgi:hypothetical protein
MRLFLAILIFVVTVLDLNFGSDVYGLDIAALSAGILLVGSVAADFAWPERPKPPQSSDAPPA